MVEGRGARQTSARVVSFVVSFVRLPGHHEALRYDTDAQNTALMLRFVVSDLAPVLNGVQGVMNRTPSAPELHPRWGRPTEGSRGAAEPLTG